jgi:hypothetical protein
MVKIVDCDQMALLGILNATDGEIYILSEDKNDSAYFELRYKPAKKGIRIPSIRIDSEMLDDLRNNGGVLELQVKESEYWWDK